MRNNLFLRIAIFLFFFLSPLFVNPSYDLSSEKTWRNEVNILRIGLLGGENEADRIKNYECWRVYLENNLKIPVKFFPASDYAGVIHGLLGGFLDYASIGASGYAAIFIENPDIVEPILTVKENDGSKGYKAAMYVKKSSEIFSLEDMKNKSIAWSDPNSTSGFLVPSYEFVKKGISINDYFSYTGFAGGHEQAVIAVLNNQYDAGVTWVSGIGEVNDGYTRGVLKNMSNKGLLDLNDIRVIWLSDIIINGPHVIQKSLPIDFKKKITNLNLELYKKNLPCYNQITNGNSLGFVKVDEKDYQNIIKMRKGIKSQRRAR